MIERTLLAAGSLSYVVLGTMHLVYTFYSSKFDPREASVKTGMEGTSPRLTGATTMWKAWVGFNASHSSGAIFFGVITMVFAVMYFEVFRDSWLFQSITIINSAFYVFLGKKYWFRIPYRGILFSTICYLIVIILIYVKP